MPVLKNARHEAFAQALSTGMSRDQAYAKAGFKPHRQNAHRLMTKDDIQRRVEELTEKAADKAEWTAADRLVSLKSIFDREAEKDPRTGISAIAEANKMQGSYAPSKHEHKGRFTVVSITPEQLGRLSADELAALETAYPVLEKLGLVAAGDPGGETEPGGEPED